MLMGIAGPPVSGGYKYGDLALQVGGVSDETVIYGTSPAGLGRMSDFTSTYRPVLSSERTPHKRRKKSVV
jgi:hypothetical protein